LDRAGLGLDLGNTSQVINYIYFLRAILGSRSCLPGSGCGCFAPHKPCVRLSALRLNSTTEEAIHKACEELGVSREDLEVEVLSNGSSGFLGMGAKNARIRATVKEKSAPRISEVRPARTVTDPQAAETAKKTLQDILRLLEVEATVDLKEESERILNDANAIAEQRMKEKFPTLPSAELPTAVLALALHSPASEEGWSFAQCQTDTAAGTASLWY
jgi:hypothetical protein